jgi:hypothetical protein
VRQLSLGAAAAELRSAASLADARAAGDLFSPWFALAGQLRLVAAGLDPTSETSAPSRLTLAAHTAAALDHLDKFGPRSAQEDLESWRRHAQRLHIRATQLSQPTDAPEGQA